MLTDIARISLTIGRELYPEIALNDLDIGTGESVGAPCPRERLEFLRAWWPKFAPALRMLEGSPRTGLRWETRMTFSERARRVSSSDLMQAIRKESIFPPRRLRERFATPDADTPDNRFIKMALATFSRDLTDIAALAEICGNPEIAGRALQLRHHFRAALRRDPWRGVTLVPNASLPSASIRSGPHRIFHDALRHYRRGFAFNWRSPIFTLPPRETWRIYEIWCLFQTADALRHRDYRTTSADCFAVTPTGLTITLKTGQGATLTFVRSGGQGIPVRRMKLTYRRNFGASGESGWRSSSHVMEPDITLERDHRLLILDAKWKAYGSYFPLTPLLADEAPRNASLTDDLNQMHAYRDGIRNGETQAVAAAWLLYPGRSRTPDEGIIAFPQSTPETPFGGGQIGALQLRPGNGMERLCDLVDKTFKINATP